MSVKRTQSTRRDFLRMAGKSALTLGVAGTAPMFVPNHVLGANPPSEKLNVGMIGLGWRGTGLMRDALRNPTIEIAAIADLDRDFLLHSLNNLDNFYGIDRSWIEGSGSGMKRPELPKKAVEPYADYRRMLERKDLDACIIAVPDHWHAKTYIDSMQAGLDVYGEKPLSLTVKEGRDIVNVARNNKRVFQTGSQQRSNDNFRIACEYVRSGRLGKISHVDVLIGGAPQTQGVPNEPIPPGLDWDMWLGPAPYVDYNPQRCHVTFRWFFDYSGGMVTDWGAHHLDITQWGLDMDDSGPLSVDGTASVKPGYYTTFTNFDFTYEYPNDIKVYLKNGGNGITFHGPKGQIFCNRGDLKSDPEDILKEPLTDDDVHLYKSNNHMQNWVDCIKTREQPITDVEIGHRSVTVCHIANICGKLGRKLFWDAEKEEFKNDAEANSMLDRPERPPYQRFG